MKILLVSDTHGHDEIYSELYRMYPKMDIYLDAGDSQTDQGSIYPFISVRGNCDYYPYEDKYRVFTPAGYLLMKHKPFFTTQELNENKILIHGHTHMVDVYEENGHVFICPGSTHLSRDITDGCYLILNIDSTKIGVEVYKIKTKSILTRYEIR